MVEALAPIVDENWGPSVNEAPELLVEVMPDSSVAEALEPSVNEEPAPSVDWKLKLLVKGELNRSVGKALEPSVKEKLNSVVVDGPIGPIWLVVDESPTLSMEETTESSVVD